MFRVLFIFFFFIFYSLQAFSSIILEGVSGASRDNLSEDRKAPIIYGGTAGTNPGTCTDVCNNCIGGLQDCNERRINDGGYLTLSFRSDTRSGIPIITDSNKQITISERILNAPIVGANETQQVRVLWSRICGDSCDNVGNNGNGLIIIVIGIDGSNNGEGNGSLNDSEDDSLQVTIQIKKNLPNNGIETFTLFPGDEKVFMLLNPRPDGGGDEALIPDSPNNIVFPNLFPFYEGSLIKEIRFYYEEMSDEESVEDALGRIGNDSTYVRKEVIRLGENSGDVDLGSTLYFTESDGPNGKEGQQFRNGFTYVFKVALVDEAGNVGLFRDNRDGIEQRQVIVPSEVMGALENKNTPSFCFIATAAYGKSHKMLDIFYKFRDQKLLPYKLGRIIHDLYYTYSPPFAGIIRDNVFLKYIARILLIPFWVYAFLALQIGHILTFFLLASFISMFMYLLIKKRIFKILLSKEV